MDFPFENEFEYDWCVCALSQVEKRLLSLKGSRWLFFGATDDSLTSAVVRFLHYADEQLSLGLLLTVFARSDERSATQKAFPFAKVATPSASVDADYSFYSTYGRGKAQPFDSARTQCSILLADEKLREIPESTAVVLRADVILAPGLQTASFTSAERRRTVCYITDFLTALILVATTQSCRGQYMLAAWEVSELNPEQLRQMPCDAHSEPAVCAEALRNIGWQPRVDFPTMAMLEYQYHNTTSAPIWLPGGHDGKLPVIQTLLFRILLEVKRICEKHNIRYFLGGGTLLGAVRHQDFIPWDDDMDIMMLREDHERFITAAQQELPEEMFLQTPKTEPGNHYLISKIRLKDTVFCSEFLARFPQLENGIFVDIIAQDYTANSRLGQKLHLKLSLLARGLVFKKWSGESATVKKKAYAVFDPIKKLLPFAFLEWFQHRVLTLFSKSSKRRYLYDSMGINISKGAYPASWLSESVEVSFREQKFPAPVQYDAYLRYLYGDYTKLVPVSERTVVHSVARLDLGPYLHEPDRPFHY